MSSEGRLFLVGLCWPSRLATCLGNRSLHWDVQVGSSEPKVLVLRMWLMPDLLPQVCVLLAHASAGVCATSQTTLGFSTQRLWITYNLQVLPLSWSIPGVRTFGSFCLVSLKSFPRHLPCFCCDSTASHTPHARSWESQSLNLGWSQHSTGES